MTSIKPGACNSAICRDDIFPVGQPVVVLVPHWELRTENRAAASIRYFRTAATVLPTRSDDWRGEMNPSNALRAFFPRRGTTRGMNFGGAIGLHSLFSTLRKFFQEPRSVFTVSFRPGPSCVVAHDRNKARSWTHEVQRNSQ